MTQPTTAEWLDLKIQVEKDSHDEISGADMHDEQYIAEVYEDYQQLLTIRAQLLAAQEMAKALECATKRQWDDQAYMKEALTAWREAGGQ